MYKDLWHFQRTKKTTLQKFFDQARHLDSHSLIEKRQLRAKWTLSWTRGEEIKEETHKVDYEEMESVLVRLRPFTLNDESVFLPRVVNILKPHYPENIEHLCSITDMFLNKKEYGKIKIVAGPQEFSEEKLFNDFMNSRVFHLDAAREERLDALGNLLDDGFVYSVLLGAIVSKVSAVARAMGVHGNACGSSLMEKEIKLKTWEGFEAEFTKLFGTVKEKREETYETGVSDPIFRGHTERSWELKTTLERFTQQKYTKHEYHQLMQRINPAVASLTDRTWEPGEFKKRDESLHRPPQGYEFMVYLRHNGFPSSLLDWTLSPYVAAFFAFRSPGNSSEDYAAIYSYTEFFGEGKNWEGDEAYIVGCGPYVETHRRHYTQQRQYTFCQKRIGDTRTYWSH